MREFVLNDACFGHPVSIDQMAAITADVENGMIALIGAGHGLHSMRLPASTSEVFVAPDVTLADVLIHMLRNTGTAGRVFARMATKYPIEDDLADDEFAALVDWVLPSFPGCLSLALCARSQRIAATLSERDEWAVDPLVMDLAQNPEEPDVTVKIEVDNVYSAVSAAELVKRLNHSFVATATPADIWNNRKNLYTDLDFAPRVERDLADLPPIQYSAALNRLGELDRASNAWTAPAPTPDYLSKVTGESKSTMDKYGSKRIFRSSSGANETFELHARLPDGFRLHLREILPGRRIEIGYIGPHLPIVSEN